MVEIIFDNFLSFLGISTFLLVSLYSWDNFFTKGKFQNFFLIVSFFGFIVSSLVSFNLNLARYTVYIFYLITLLQFVRKLYHSPGSFKFFLYSNKPLIVLLGFCGFFILIYIFFNLKFFLIYNSHDPYFYGIPFEIIKGDYFSRIRIWDNYPITWSKYHFFPGSFSSLFLLFTFTKNIFLYKTYFLIQILIFFFLLNEIIDLKKKVLTHLLIFASPLVVWLLSTNGLTPIVFIVLFLFYFDKSEYTLSFLCLLFFSSSLSKHVLPGFLSLMILVFIFRKSIKFSWRYLIFLIPPVLNMLSMIFIGELPIGVEMNLKDILDFKNINNFFYGQSGSFFVQNLIYQLYNNFFVNPISLNSILILFPLIYFAFLFKEKKYLYYILIITITSFLSQIFISDYFRLESSLNNFGLLKNFCLGMNSFLTFLFPFYLIINANIKRTLKIVFLILGTTSVLSLLIFNRGITENYAFIEILVLYLLLITRETHLVRLNSSLVYGVFILFTIIPRFDDSHTFFLKTSKMKFNHINKTNKNLDNLEIEDKLIYFNIYGERNYYSNNHPDIYSVSREFLNPNN